MLVEVEELEHRFPRPLVGDDRDRARVKLIDAEDLMRDEFAREGRDFDAEIQVDWMRRTAGRVIREMVSASLLVGDRAGIRQHSVTAGQVTESATYADVGSTAWGELVLTDKQREQLGLMTPARPLWSFPDPPRFPEV